MDMGKLMTMWAESKREVEEATDKQFENKAGKRKSQEDEDDGKDLNINDIVKNENI